MTQDDLTDLTIALSRSLGSIDEELRLICQTTAKLIPNSSRVSLWKFSENKDQIDCLICLENPKGTFSSGMILSKKDFPEYFDAILTNSVIKAPDALHHDATRCFNESYFKPNNIYSLLDYIYHKDFEPLGVICCESVGRQVDWSEDDVVRLRKISSLVSIFQH